MARTNIVLLAAQAFCEDPSLQRRTQLTISDFERSHSGAARALALETVRRGLQGEIINLHAIAKDLAQVAEIEDPLVALTLPPKVRSKMPITLRSRIPSTRPALRTLIETAAREVILMAPYSDPPVARDLVPWLEVAIANGACIRFVLEQSEAYDHAPFFRALWNDMSATARKAVRFCATRKEEGRISHAKLVIVDGKQCYVGSGNLTRYAYSQNFEAGIVLGGRAARDLHAAVEWYLRNMAIDEWLPASGWKLGST